MRTASIAVIGIGVPIGVIVSGLVLIKAINQHHADKVAAHQERLRYEDRSRAEADMTGGVTPAETLSLFSSAIREGDAEKAGGLCVPTLRDEVIRRVRALDKEARESTAALLDTAAESASSSSKGESYVTNAPVYVELVKFPSGIWKVASF